MLKSCAFFVILGLTQVSTTWLPRNLQVCKSWSCINSELFPGGDGSQPTRGEVESYLARRLAGEEWGDDAKIALDRCFGGEKPRMYAKLCPGQETWHCVVDQLIQNCPKERTKEEKSCSQVGSLAGFKYLFYQNVYEDVNNTENKNSYPSFFMKHVFKSKCCDLPDLFSQHVLNTCNVTTFMNSMLMRPNKPVNKSAVSEAYCAQNFESINPFECCDMSDIIKPETFDTCSLNMEWQKGNGLVVIDKMDALEEEINKVPHKKHATFVKVVPEAAKPLHCVFTKLNITRKDEIDKKAFDRLLNNLTREHPAWRVAKSKIPQRCFHRDLKIEYEGSPEQRLLACVVDVLSENCPHRKNGFPDPCRHSLVEAKPHTVCEISNSKFRRPPHHFCDLPRLAPQKTLEDCGLISLTRMEVIKHKHPIPPPKKHSFIQNKPQFINKEANCVLERMGVLKNNRVDMFHMTDYLNKTLSKNRFWTHIKPRVEESTKLMLNYAEHDESTRRILNLVDATLTNCPTIKRKYTNKCARFYGYQSKCTNATNIHPVSKYFAPSVPFKTSLSAPKVNQNVPPKIYVPITHTIATHSSYAPKYVNYNQKFSPYTRYAPKIPTTAELKVQPSKILTEPLLISSIYRPTYSYGHGYSLPSYKLSDQLKVKDVFKTNNNLFHQKLEQPFPVEGQVYA